MLKKLPTIYGFKSFCIALQGQLFSILKYLFDINSLWTFNTKISFGVSRNIGPKICKFYWLDLKEMMLLPPMFLALDNFNSDEYQGKAVIYTLYD